MLIVDKNPKIRAFLKREMESDGYRVQLAESAGQALRWDQRREPVQLIVLDPDLPDTDACRVLTNMHRRFPSLPVVIHTFASVYRTCRSLPSMPGRAIFIEKNGDSIEVLKQVVTGILKERGMDHGAPPCR